MRTLPQRCYRVLREMARTLFETDSPVPESRLDWLMAELRDVFAHVGALTLLVFRLSIALVQFAPLLLLGLPRRFTGLGARERNRYLERVEGSLLTLPYVALKMYLCMVYFEHPEALARTGFDGKPLLVEPLSPPPPGGGGGGGGSGSGSAGGRP